MTVISSGAPVSAMHYMEQEGIHEMDKDNDEIQNGDFADLWGEFMYNEWKNKILLSDGVHEDDNPEW